MTQEKKTHYQVSFTGGQALIAVVTLLFGLGLAFFFGAKAGFERAVEPEPAPIRREAPVTAASPTPSAPLPPAVTTTSPAGTVAPGATATEDAPIFEDREAGVAAEPRTGPESAAPMSSSSPSRTEIAGSPSSPKAVPPPKTPKPAASPSLPRKESPAAPAKEKASPASSSKKGARFFVQVLSTSSRSEASRWKDRLAARTYRSAAVTSVDTKKGKLYRVRIGPYSTRALANDAAAKINADFHQKAWVAAE
jgi:DedD protein